MRLRVPLSLCVLTALWHPFLAAGDKDLGGKMYKASFLLLLAICAN